MAVNRAEMYDEFMGQAPYESWREWTKDFFRQQGYVSPKIADIGCGTGTLMSMLIEDGYDVQGVDISADMLALAERKIRMHYGFTPRLSVQDMADLHLDTPVDIILVYCDALNYLLEAAHIKKAFFSFYANVKPGGGVLFDVHSLYKMMDVFPGYSYGDNEADGTAFIWNSYGLQGMEAGIEHELSFFRRQKQGLYERLDEWHQQRSFSIQTYKQWLQEAGFQEIKVSADFKKEPPKANSERIFFSARKL